MCTDMGTVCTRIWVQYLHGYEYSICMDMGTVCTRIWVQYVHGYRYSMCSDIGTVCARILVQHVHRYGYGMCTDTSTICAQIWVQYVHTEHESTKWGGMFWRPSVSSSDHQRLLLQLEDPQIQRWQYFSAQ